jgi:hypothetical protein|uniref:Uncharacterized protein n=1 Tax=Rhodococcus sp. Mel TaxID=1093626 RepID=H8ZKV5_9NOCA|nr:hypothetical protein [Rhodococcus sp. Mel]
MTTTTTPAVDVDVWGYTPGRCARLKPPTASGDVDQVAAAAYALIVAAAAHGWPTATALVFKYERTGPVAHLWGAVACGRCRRACAARMGRRTRRRDRRVRGRTCRPQPHH